MRRALVLAAGFAAVVPIAGYVKWRKDSGELTRAIETRAAVATEVFTRDRVSILPDPVARYFRRTLPEGQRHIRLARIEQEGEFLLNGAWRPLRATQVFSGRPAGFIWDARISMAPFLPVYVRDGYIAGTASMQAYMLALYPFVNQSNTRALNAGALMRYLAEAAWFPTALLPSDAVTWSAVDGRSARVTLTDAGIAVSLQFTFDETGDIVEIYAPDRMREVNGQYVPTPWRVRALGHEPLQGVRIMSPAEVEWILPEGPTPYWRGRITRASYE